jgi:SAM-dependent methyltransferase
MQLHEFVFRTFFRVAAAGGSLGQRIAYLIYFGWVHRNADAWNYASSAYEVAKYDRTLRVIAAFPAGRALEAGCCEGAFTAALLERAMVREIVGVDISAQALARARVRCSDFRNAQFVQTNLAFDAPPGPFDLIVCAETLYYLGARSADACVLLRAQLAPGGRIVAVHPADRAAALHAPWMGDASLVREHHELVSDAMRPYVIEVFRG